MIHASIFVWIIDQGMWIQEVILLVAEVPLQLRFDLYNERRHVVDANVERGMARVSSLQYQFIDWLNSSPVPQSTY